MKGPVADTPVAWRSFPLFDDFPRSLVAPAAVLGVSFVAALGFGVFGGVISVVFLFFSLAKYFFPTYYELSSEGVRSTFLVFTTKRPWNYFNNYYPHEMGVHLTPLEQPGALDSFRGWFVRFSDNRMEVLDYIAGRIGTGR